MANYWEDSENWQEGLYDFIREQMGDLELPDLDDNDMMLLSDLATKVRRGDLSLHAAVHRLYEHIIDKRGYRVCANEEEFMLEMSYGSLVDVTDSVHTYLLIAGEPGLADAIVHIYAHPALMMLDPGEATPHELVGEACIGFHAKAWFQVDRMSPSECKTVDWAVKTALKDRLGGN